MISTVFVFPLLLIAAWPDRSYDDDPDPILSILAYYFTSRQGYMQSAGS